MIAFRDDGVGKLYTPYAFYRSEGFYVLDFEDDADALKQVPSNPGTIKIINLLTGEKIWSE